MIAAPEKMAVPAASGLSDRFGAMPFGKLVRPPVQVYSIEGHYAIALYSSASEENKLDQVAGSGQLLKGPKVSGCSESLRQVLHQSEKPE